MANNMDSFDFDALDSAALDETLAFLNNYDPSLLPDPSFAGFGDFGDPMMDWPVAENPTWVPFGSAHLSGGVTNALTDGSLPGFHFPNPGRGVENQPHQPHHSMGTGTPLCFGESSCNKLCLADNACNETATSQTLVFSARSPKILGGLNILRNSFPQISKQDVSNLNEFHQPMNEPSLRRLSCDWPSCKSVTTYATTRDLQNHQTDVHIADILKDWPGSCSWPGCRSKIFFKTSKRLESHVYNIHITPLCCTTKGCDHDRPFERQADLERHAASRHSTERKYKCAYPRCGHKSSFSRKDKLKQHERTFHGQFSCQLNHCIYGFPSEELLRKHKINWSYHGPYECELGSCRRTSASRFPRWRLTSHLEYDHLISSEATQKAMGKTTYRECILTLAHLPDGFSDFQDCKGCIEKLKAAASGGQGEEEK